MVLTILLLNEAFSFYSFIISRLFGKRKLNLRASTSLFNSLKKILVLNVAFSKSVLVLIKKMSVHNYDVLISHFCHLITFVILQISSYFFSKTYAYLLLLI